MIVHAVFFDLKKDVDLDKVSTFLAAIRRSVPGLYEIQFGPQVSKPYDGYVDRSSSYTHALVSKHHNAEALKTYALHPDHVSLATYLRTVFVRPAQCIDFEAPGPSKL